jgi:hypothetical protein
MRIKLLLLTCMIVYNSIGQNVLTDSINHFAKGVYFLMKDSTEKKEIIYRTFQYKTESARSWNQLYSKWEMKTVNQVKIDQFYPDESVSEIDSVYFGEGIVTEEIRMTCVCPGSDKEYTSKNRSINVAMREELGRFKVPRPKCRLFLWVIIVDSKGKKQKTEFRIY